MSNYFVFKTEKYGGVFSAPWLCIADTHLDISVKIFTVTEIALYLVNVHFFVQDVV